MALKDTQKNIKINQWNLIEREGQQPDILLVHNSMPQTAVTILLQENASHRF